MDSPAAGDSMKECEAVHNGFCCSQLTKLLGMDLVGIWILA